MNYGVILIFNEGDISGPNINRIFLAQFLKLNMHTTFNGSAEWQNSRYRHTPQEKYVRPATQSSSKHKKKNQK